jgi:hypothetical protein
MKKVHKTLAIEKFNISKLNNLSTIVGGVGVGDGDDPHRTKALSSEICETVGL